MSINLQQKIFPKLYDFKGAYICELTEALNVNESLRLGSLNTLNFEYPIYQVDSFNNLTKDSFGNPIRNPKADFIENDIRCLFNNNWYIIKIDEDTRDDSNKLTISCSCYDIAYTLQETMVEYLDLTPPITLAVNATNALALTLEAAQQVRDNLIVSASTNTVTLDANAHPVNNSYNGYKIKIVSGTGVGQERTITDYDGTTKIATLSSAFSPQPTATSVYRIYNDVWRVGTVDSAFNTDLRAHYFDFVNGLDAIQQVRDKYFDANDEVGYLTYSSSFNVTTGRWQNLVNLVKANPYAGVDLRYQKNLKSVTRRKESQELYTRIIPNGVDNLTVGSQPTAYRIDSLVNYPEHISGYNYIDNFQYFLAQGYSYKDCLDNFVKTYHFEDARYTTASALYNDSRKMLSKMSMPKFTYLVSALDLSKLTGREYESFDIGDTIRVFDEEQGIDIYAVISVIDRSQDEPQNASIEITNYVDRMSDIMKRLVQRGDNYTDISSYYGNAVTYIIADKKTSKNWRQADFVVQEFESASVIIQKVVDQLDSIGGGVIVLLAGEYGFTTTVNLKDNIVISGEGASTRIYPKLNVGATFNITGKKNVTITSLFIDYYPNEAGDDDLYHFTDGIGIYSGSDNIVVESIIQEYVSNNMLIAISSSNITVKNNLFTSKVLSFHGTDVVDIKACNNAKIQNNTIEILGAAARSIIGIADQVGDATGNFYIENNIITQITPVNTVGIITLGTGLILVNTIDGNVIISNNKIYTEYYDFVEAIVLARAARSVIISNNKIEGVLSTCRSVIGIGETVSVQTYEVVNATISSNEIIASNNRITDCMGIAINSRNSATIVQNNKVRSNPLFPTNPLGYGCVVFTNVVGVLVSNNDFRNSGVTSSFLNNGTGTVLLGGNAL